MRNAAVLTLSLHVSLVPVSRYHERPLRPRLLSTVQTMPIHVSCPSCGKDYQLKDAAAGKTESDNPNDLLVLMTLRSMADRSTSATPLTVTTAAASGVASNANIAEFSPPLCAATTIGRCPSVARMVRGPVCSRQAAR